MISILLPTFNEVENIGDLIDSLSEVLVNHDVEFIVIDDNSSDGTAELIQNKSIKDSRIRLISRIDKRGLTSAIQDGVDISRGDIVVWMDTDFSMPPKIVPILLKKIEEGYDAAVGSRFIKGGGFKGQREDGGPDTIWTIIRNLKKGKDSFLVVVLSRLLNYFIQFMLNYSFKDYTSGFIVIKKNILVDIRFHGDYGEYFIDLIYKVLRKGYKVIEIPYVCLPRKYGESKTGKNIFDYLKRGIKYVTTTVKLRLQVLNDKRITN